ncbi:protein ANTAGONIST OF LIKE HETEROCHROMATIN PROTEIN 1-like isoform X2 [Perca fluviatilis]|uniref:protein ANTAGONIST OF LIKE HETEROCHROMATIN PROTEIN 1-like isoform X2 n=1 Tax=Perca fluviatilis TaxID=8168 RepID=UPI001966714B|nr:protein ANTAGONIST OF LIKE HETEROCHROMATIN PROTEIN 1-like isoform X2 [Perca fluviatilis]
MEDSSVTAALLCSVVSLSGSPVPPPVSGTGLSELWRLQAAVLRRGRAREMLQRDRRRRQYLRRRRAFLLSSITAILSLISASSSRHVWVRNRTPGHNFWAQAQTFDQDEWKAQFRVSRDTFDYLLDRIGPAIRRRRTNYRAPIEPRRRLAITLWWLARSGEYRSIAGLFGVGIATVCVIVRQVTWAIVERLYRRVVSLAGGWTPPWRPSGTAATRSAPAPSAALTSPSPPPGTTQTTTSTGGGGTRWCCRPWSTTTPGVFLFPNSFTDVYAGWPGGTSSAAVLSSSDLYLKAEDRPDGYLFPRQNSVVCDGVEIPVHLIGDASFPLKPWLMKSYPPEQQRQSAERRRFSSSLAAARCVVHAAFTRLRGRWRCLLKKSDVDVSVMPRVVAACCVLHNVCQSRRDAFLPEWDADISPPANGLRQPHAETHAGDTYCTAEVIRDTLAHNMTTILQY